MGPLPSQAFAHLTTRPPRTVQLPATMALAHTSEPAVQTPPALGPSITPANPPYRPLFLPLPALSFGFAPSKRNLSLLSSVYELSRPVSLGEAHPHQAGFK